MSIVRVTTVQLPAMINGSSFAQKQSTNREILLSMLGRAAGSDLVLFGEYSNLYHRTSFDVPDEEYVPEPVPGPLTMAVGEYARKLRTYVVLPVFGTYKGEVSSYAVIIDRTGEVMDCYQKTHPTIQEQQKGIRAGNNIPVFQCDFGKIGIMICMDIEYPEVAQVLMTKGADLVLFPHVQGSWGEIDWEIRYRARAIDTGLYLVSACYGYEPGSWSTSTMVGRSGFVGRDGIILGDLGRDIGTLSADLDLERKRITHFFFERSFDRTIAVKASRRPELYRDLAETKYRDTALTELNKQRENKRT
jgi:predicted amidohydrolase